MPEPKKTNGKAIFLSLVVIVAAVVLIVVMLGDDDQDAPPSRSSAVSPASEEQIESVTMGLEKGFKLQNVYAQKIKANEYAIAARMTGPGVDEIAIWFVRHTSTGSVGNVYSHEAVTAEFSEWPLHREFTPSGIATNLKKYTRSKQ